jgi:subtilisin family serine protease
MPGTKTIVTIREHDPTQNILADGHGACVASKIAGRTYGVAKNIAHTTILKLPYEAKGSDFLEALYSIGQHVHINNRRGKAVVNLSSRCKYTYPSISELGLTSTLVSLEWTRVPQFRNCFKEAFEALIEKDVVAVVSSGNDRVRVF